MFIELYYITYYIKNKYQTTLTSKLKSLIT